MYPQIFLLVIALMSNRVLVQQVRRSDLPRKAGALLAVSQSGETKDVHRAVKIGEEVRCTVTASLLTVLCYL
jgi:fructoselysine-6-P-deglycase FrlB-like protein